MIVIATRFILFTILLFICWTFGFPLYIDIIVFILLLSFILFLNVTNVLIITTSLIISAVFINLLLANETIQVQTFYRDHEKFILGERYKPNVNEIVNMPHGDLLAIDPSAPRSLAQPRDVFFKTDSLGYRNNSEFIDQKIILSGDSFVVGNGTDQKSTLFTKLSDAGVSNYSIAIPSDPASYEARAREFLDSHTGNYKFVNFYYEGNDFKSIDSTSTIHPRNFMDTYFSFSDTYDLFRIKIFSNYLPINSFTKVITGMRQRAERMLYRNSANNVTLYTAGGLPYGALDSHTAMSFSNNLELLDFTARTDVLEKTKCVFFIPTKMRVYAKLALPQIQQKIVSPAPGYLALIKRFAGTNIKVVDLTQTLEKQAEFKLKEGKLIYWRDDTHWAPDAIAAVIPDILDCLGNS